MIEPRILEVRTKILKKNDELAREMRDDFVAAGVLVLNLVSSPGTGKTSLLLETLRRLVAGGHQVAAIVGDLETDNDARRLAESGHTRGSSRLRSSSSISPTWGQEKRDRCLLMDMSWSRT